MNSKNWATRIFFGDLFPEGARLAAAADSGDNLTGGRAGYPSHDADFTAAAPDAIADLMGTELSKIRRERDAMAKRELPTCAPI
ncbi:MAG: hypothetical protein ACC628_23905, partial [Pirellulaceae bacterium]